MDEFSVLYRRNLPHIQPYGAMIFLTYRLHGSLPTRALEQLRRQRAAMETHLRQSLSEPSDVEKLRNKIRRRIFLKFDEAMHGETGGPTWLGVPDIAEMMKEAMFHRHPNEYEMVCFTIMPNHVHQIVINRRADIPFYQTIGQLKSYTATMANRHLSRTGHKFWQRESFDHVIRKGRLFNTIRYVLNNPVKAGLVDDWRAWRYSWLHPRFADVMETQADVVNPHRVGLSRVSSSPETNAHRQRWSPMKIIE